MHDKHETKRHQKASFVKSFVFGVEDSLVSTVGLLSGITVAGVGQNNVILAGVVLIFVEALSMGAGSFLSESHGDEYEAQSSVALRPMIFSAIVMFLSYFVAGFIPLAPYLFLPLNQALLISVILSLLALFVLGLFSARLARVSLLSRGLRMLIVGGLAILVGIAASFLV